MSFDERPQLPLTTRKKVLVGIGATLFIAQLILAWVIAPMITGPHDANAALLAISWAGSVAVSVAAVLMLVRQADLPDVATASLTVMIATFAAFALSAGFDLRGTEDEVNLIDTLFFGVTSGALTGLLVWAAAMGVARVLKLPRTGS